MSHWAGDIFMLTFPDAANNQAVRVDLIRVTENNCSCSENLPKYLSQPLWLLLSVICLLTVVNQHNSIIEICDLSIGCVLLTCSSFVFICKVCILQYVWFPIWAHWHCRRMKVKYILDIPCFFFGCPLNNKTLGYWCVKVKYHQIYDHICEQAW